MASLPQPVRRYFKTSLSWLNWSIVQDVLVTQVVQPVIQQYLWWPALYKSRPGLTCPLIYSDSLPAFLPASCCLVLNVDSSCLEAPALTALALQTFWLISAVNLRVPIPHVQRKRSLSTLSGTHRSSMPHHHDLVPVTVAPGKPGGRARRQVPAVLWVRQLCSSRSFIKRVVYGTGNHWGPFSP